MSSKPNRAQIEKVLKKQALAKATLTGFARYIDIPGVPLHDGVSDREYEEARLYYRPETVEQVVVIEAPPEDISASEPDPIDEVFEYVPL